MSDARKDHDAGRDDPRRDEEGHHLHPGALDPEKPAVGVDDVIETFDREPPERPVSDADAQPPFG